LRVKIAFLDKSQKVLPLAVAPWKCKENNMRSFMQKWFPWLASLAVFGSAMSIGVAMQASTKAGAFCWYIYPAFALLTILILAANQVLYRNEQG
jgi:hypothetical protein